MRDTERAPAAARDVEESAKPALTGWVLAELPSGDEEVAETEHTMVELIGSGLSERAGAAA